MTSTLRPSHLLCVLLLLTSTGCLTAGCAGDMPPFETTPDKGAPAPDLGSGTPTGDGPIVPPSPQPDATPPAPAPDLGVPTEPSAADKATFEQLVTFMKARMQAQGVLGGAVGVLLPGRTPLLRGLGIKRKGSSEAVTADTAFSLGSVSKMFTAATAATLVQEGKLRFDDKVLAHFPTLKTSDATRAAQLTVAQLLSHTSGLGYLEDAAWNTANIDWSAPNYHMQIFERLAWPLWAPPGAVWNYSNPGYSLAGAVVEKAGGGSFGAQVRARVLAPAGMNGSCASAADVGSLDHADGHDETGKVVAAGLDISGAFDDPANGIYASAPDMLRFAAHLMGAPGPLTKASIDALTSMQAPFSHAWAKEGYGYGFFVRPHGSATVIDHGGSNRGFTSFFQFVPQKGFAVVVLMNSARGNPAEVAARAEDLFVTLPPEDGDWTPSTPAELSKLAGTYQDPFSLGKVTISVGASGALSATFAQWNHTAKLQQADKRLFYLPISAQMQTALDAWSELDLSIEVDASGQGQYLVSLWGVGARSGP